MKTQEQWAEEEEAPTQEELHRAGICRFNNYPLCWEEHEALTAFLDDGDEDAEGFCIGVDE